VPTSDLFFVPTRFILQLYLGVEMEQMVSGNMTSRHLQTKLPSR
jgi:hypothetical protein